VLFRSVAVLLKDVAGPDFPASPVELRFHAIDGSGMERLVKVSVIPMITV